MIEILVPRENVNDEEVVILEIMFSSGTEVKEGDLLFEIETSKVNIDIEAPADGIITHDLEIGDNVDVGGLICTISSSDGDLKESKKEEKAKKEITSKARISKGAKKLAEELNVDLSVFKEGLVSKKDVLEEAMKKESKTLDLPKINDTSVIIFGGGGHAKMCIDILKQNNEFNVVGIVDSKLPVGNEILGVKIIGNEDSLKQIYDEGVSYAINGVGSITNPSVRKEIFDKLKKIGFKIPTIIHPSAIVEPSAHLEEGCQIMMGACVGSDVTIKANCIINSKSVISHDSCINSHAQISPGAILAGEVTVDELAVVGMGSTVYLGVTIGKKALVHNGVNVFKDVDENEVVQN